MEQEPLPPKVSAKTADLLNVREVFRLFQGSVPESVKSPGDVLNENLRATLLDTGVVSDGVYINQLGVDGESRREYFDGIQAQITALGVDVAEFPPTDLEYLLTLVSGVTGPGQHFLVSHCQCFNFMMIVLVLVLRHFV